MYLNFYGLKEKPFAVTPDSSFFFKSRYHSEAFNHLLYGIRSKEGFILVTGDIGTGKTTLCRTLLNELTEKTHTALIFNPSLTEMELLKAIIQDLGITSRGESKKDLIDDLNQFLLDCSLKGETVILIIDEAQNLLPEVLEEVRLLSNLETEKEKLIQIILVGQTELEEKLKLPYLRQLNQRISIRYHLRPIERYEVERYIHHRLMRAGSFGDIYFTPGAFRKIYNHSKGIPRTINLICDKALLAGYIAQKKRLTGKMVKEAILTLKTPSPRWNLKLHPSPAMLVIILMLLLGWFQTKWINKKNSSLIQITNQYAEAKIPESMLNSGIHGLDRASSDRNRTSPKTEEFDNSNESLVTLLEIWGIQRERISQEIAFWKNDLKKFNFSEKARSFGLEATSSMSDIERIRLMNYPCIVELRERDNPLKHYFAALIQLTPQAAVVIDPRKGRITISLTELASTWTRLTIFLWRNFDGIDEEIKKDNVHPAIRVLKKRLEEIGLLNNYLPDNNFDEQLEEAVRNLQRRYHLRDDGIVGSKTKMVLYRSLPSLYLPCLTEKVNEPH